MFRRIAILSILCVAALALSAGSAAVAKKKPPPKLKLGAYVGTTSNGIPLTVTLNPGRTSGSIYYCSMTTTFTVTGKSFAVFYQDLLTLDTIGAAGTFKAKRKPSGKVVGTVAGSIDPNGCDSAPQTFALQRK
jgi:hypothetical protein